MLGLQNQISSNLHKQCISSNCIAWDINEADYTQKHCIECNQYSCIPSEVDSAEVAEIITNCNGVPVIACLKRANEGPQIKVTAAKPETDYVAISHVWAGGLGNTSKNALPNCQVKRLKNLVQKASESISPVSSHLGTSIGSKISHFWIDTLCIPP